MNVEHLAGRRADGVRVARRRGDVRTAGTTYLMYRGRHEHEARASGADPPRHGAVMRRPRHGPEELFYADIFASRETGCRSQLGLPGIARPAHRLRRRLPRRARPLRLPAALAARQRHALAQARPARPGAVDRRRPPARAAHARRRRGRRVPRRARGHRRRRPLARAGRAAREARRRVRRVPRAPPSGAGPDEAEIALCPAQRAAMVYALLPEGREALVPRLVDTAPRSRASTS